jgi:hypothetical protein
MVVARMRVRGKGRQSLAPPQHTEFPEREQRSGNWISGRSRSPETERSKCRRHEQLPVQRERNVERESQRSRHSAKRSRKRPRSVNNAP